MTTERTLSDMLRANWDVVLSCARTRDAQRCRLVLRTGKPHLYWEGRYWERLTLGEHGDFWSEPYNAFAARAKCPCGEPSPIGAKPCTPEQPCSYG